MAYAVMEGVAHLLRKNCDSIRASGTGIDRIIATGGGAKSAVWCQLQADVTGVPVEIPAEKEAACLGAAVIAAVSSACTPVSPRQARRPFTSRRALRPVKARLYRASTGSFSRCTTRCLQSGE
jgi:sugar (pentulose or hexulose) kinase